MPTACCCLLPLQVFDAGRFQDGSADIALEPVRAVPVACVASAVTAAARTAARPATACCSACMSQGGLCPPSPHIPGASFQPTPIQPRWQGLCAEYDQALARLERLHAAAGAAVEGLRQGLREAAHGTKTLARVKLVDWKGEQLLEVSLSSLSGAHQGISCARWASAEGVPQSPAPTST